MDSFDEKARALILGTVAISRADETNLAKKFAQALREADQAGFRRGVEASDGILTDELKDLSICDWNDSDTRKTTVRAWLMNARERIRALVPEREGK